MTWFDRHEPITPFFVRDGSSCSREVRIERRVMAIDVMRVAARGICLPDLHERARQRAPVLVQHPPLDHDPLTERSGGMLACQVAVDRADGFIGIDRTR